MVRVPPAPIEGPNAPHGAIARIQQLRSGELSTLYRTLLHAPSIAAGWCALGTAVRYESSLDDRLRELVTCQVAALVQAPYEWRKHEPLARAAGVTDQQLRCLPDVERAEGFDDRDLSALRFVTAVVQRTMDDDLFTRTGEHFSLDQRVELAATASYYLSIAHLLDACNVT